MVVLTLTGSERQHWCGRGSGAVRCGDGLLPVAFWRFTPLRLEELQSGKRVSSIRKVEAAAHLFLVLPYHAEAGITAILWLGLCVCGCSYYWMVNDSQSAFERKTSDFGPQQTAFL